MLARIALWGAVMVVLTAILLGAVNRMQPRPAPAKPLTAVGGPLVAPAPPQPAADPSTVITAAALERLKPLMKDPSSIQLQNVIEAPKAPGEYCGLVNGKNAYGGFVGFRGFVTRKGEVWIDSSSTIEHLAYETTAAESGCI